MRIKRLCALLTAMVLFLSGCSTFGTDVETQLRAPRTTGEQKQIQQALSDFLSKTGMQNSYVLKYPQSGAYRSAFIVEDIDGDGAKEALVFYRVGTEKNATHFNLLRQTEGEWVSVSDVEGISTDVSAVSFGDLNGDGVKELFIGWGVYSNRTRQLVLYSLRDNTFVEHFSQPYTSLVVGNLVSNACDDFLLLNATDSGAITASLWSMQESILQKRGSVELDGFIQQFRTARIVKLSDDVNGVYIDCVKSDNLWITELLYWDGERLRAPLYGANNNTNSLTARAVDIPSYDIDEDGEIEWPHCTLLPGYEDEEDNTLYTTRWLTTFCSWKLDTQQVTEEFPCLYNADDKYYLMLTSKMVDSITTVYSADTRTLDIYTLKDGKLDTCFLSIRTSGGKKASAGTREFTELTTNGSLKYSVWISPNSDYTISMDELRYRLVSIKS